eukprot:3392481-Pyramimonas_sp.AAC.1
MSGNSRLRSTRPVLDEQIAPLSGIISALIRQQTLVNLSLERLAPPVNMEQEEMLERQEVIRKLTSQRMILANA